MSIVRIGLAETKDFSEGWEAIFGKKKKPTKKTATGSAKPARAKKKSTKKK